MNLPYETALKLKEAGFPTSCGQTYCDNCTFFQEGVDEGAGTPEGFIHIPTLEEIIEACGEIKFELSGGWGDGWYAISDPDGESQLTGRGSTPTEAVANLYLALNSK